jgi:hypothetical protein
MQRNQRSGTFLESDKKSFDSRLPGCLLTAHWTIPMLTISAPSKEKNRMNAQTNGMMLAVCWALTTVVGCGERPITAAASVTKTAPPLEQSPLQDLKFTLPEGWKAAYDGVSRWKIAPQGPVENPVVLIWSLPPEQAPRDLIAFSHTLQTSSTLTEGKCILDRATEQGNFADGYYVVGKFFLRADREVKDLGLAMIRKLGGHTLIFECLKINDPERRQEVLDICKSARFTR